MIEVDLKSTPEADVDVETAFDWYEKSQVGLGLRFLTELRACYARITAGPLKCQVVKKDIRRALLHRFPYAVYFVVEEDHAVVLAVLHAGRNPLEWQRR